MLVCVVVTVPLLKREERSDVVVAVDITDARLEPAGGLLVREGGGGGTRRTGFRTGEVFCETHEGEEIREFNELGDEGGLPRGSRRDGSFGGSGLTLSEAKSFSHSFVDDNVGLATSVEDTVSNENESSILSRSLSASFPAPVSTLAIGYDAI